MLCVKWLKSPPPPCAGGRPDAAAEFSSSNEPGCSEDGSVVIASFETESQAKPLGAAAAKDEDAKKNATATNALVRTRPRFIYFSCPAKSFSLVLLNTEPQYPAADPAGVRRSLPPSSKPVRGFTAIACAEPHFGTPLSVYPIRCSARAVAVLKAPGS